MLAGSSTGSTVHRTPPTSIGLDDASTSWIKVLATTFYDCSRSVKMISASRRVTRKGSGPLLCLLKNRCKEKAALASQDRHYKYCSRLHSKRCACAFEAMCLTHKLYRRTSRAHGRGFLSLCIETRFFKETMRY